MIVDFELLHYKEQVLLTFLRSQICYKLSSITFINSWIRDFGYSPSILLRTLPSFPNNIIVLSSYFSRHCWTSIFSNSLVNTVLFTYSCLLFNLKLMTTSVIQDANILRLQPNQIFLSKIFLLWAPHLHMYLFCLHQGQHRKELVIYLKSIL